MAATRRVVDIPCLTSACVDLAERAGFLLKSLAEKNYNVNTAVNKKDGNVSVDQKEFEKKAPQALLTEADLEAQRLIVGGLTTAFPELPIVGEEDESLAGETLPSIQPDVRKLHFETPPDLQEAQWKDFCVYVDPLDGTKQFCLSKFFAVSVLIGITFKGVPTIGIIHEPWRENSDGSSGLTTWDVVGLKRDSPSLVSWISEHSEQKRPLGITVGDKPMKPILGAIVETLQKEGVIHVGATGHKMAKICRGEANCYLQDPNACCRWDICAGEAIFRARGGVVVDLNGNDYTYDPSPKGNHVNDGGVVALRYPVDHLEDVLRVTKNNFDTNSVTRHTDGSLISSGWLLKALQDAKVDTSNITGFHADESTIVKEVNSHSIKININRSSNSPAQPSSLFFKRIVCKDLPEREHWDRDVKSYCVESNFLRHLAPLVRGLVTLPVVYYTENNLSSPASLSSFLTISEFLNGWHHRLHFEPRHAKGALKLLAQFHSSAWNDEEKLEIVRKEMWPKASYWDVSKRKGRDSDIMPERWEKEFLPNFRSLDEEFFGLDEVKNLGVVTAKWQNWLDKRIHSRDHHLSLVHGDYKAANLFFREPKEGCEMEEEEQESKKDRDLETTMIDFQWCGVGSPAQDVSYLLISSIPITEGHWKKENIIADVQKDEKAGQEGYEESLLRFYYSQLAPSIREDYSWSQFVVDYKISFADYTRFSMGFFIWKCTIESMKKIENHLPAGLQRKSPSHCLWMLKRHLSIIQELEKTGDVSDNLFPSFF